MTDCTVLILNEQNYIIKIFFILIWTFIILRRTLVLLAVLSWVVSWAIGFNSLVLIFLFIKFLMGNIRMKHIFLCFWMLIVIFRNLKVNLFKWLFLQLFFNNRINYLQIDLITSDLVPINKQSALNSFFWSCSKFSKLWWDTLKLLNVFI